jgi:serine/threonine protein kinase
MMTAVGVLLGTAAYMSPEQARGKPVDKRADIWAFGCVLFEMLGGKRAFAGEDATDTLAFIITKEPDWNALPIETPPFDDSCGGVWKRISDGGSTILAMHGSRLRTGGTKPLARRVPRSRPRRPTATSNSSGSPTSRG